MNGKQLASKVNHQREVRQTLLQEVEELRRGEEHQESVENKELFLQTDKTQKDIEEVTPKPEQDSSEITHES